MRSLRLLRLQLLIRSRHMILGWGAVGLVYAFTSAFQSHGVTLAETALDRMIAFNPAGIWVYLSFFILIPYTFITAQPHKLLWLRSSMQTCAVVCGLIFLVYPTTLLYPAITGDGMSQNVLRFLASSDSSQNCLPSLHGALTLLCAWALLDRKRKLHSGLAVLWAMGIFVSIIQLRRHVSIDLAAGMAVGLVYGWLCMQWAANKRKLVALVARNTSSHTLPMNPEYSRK
jgi:membrane-associated phospholipid phosphatase